MTAASPETQSAAKNSKFAWWCFIALAGMAIPFYLFLGRKQWFSFDEWDFIAGRNAYYEFEINALNTIYEVFWIWKDALVPGSPCFGRPEFDPAAQRTMVIDGIGGHCTSP